MTALALLFAGLSVAETMTYHRWEQEIVEQRDIQIKVDYFQRLDGVLDRLLRRMAIDSQRDPALAQLLKENNVNLIVKGAQPVKEVPHGEEVPPPSVNLPQPDKPAPSPADATPPHP